MYVRIGRHTVLKIKSDQQHFSYFKRFFYRSFVVTNKSWSDTYDSFRPHNHSEDLKDISRVKYLSSCQTVFPIERVVLLKFSANAVKQVYLLLRVPSIILGVFIWNWIVEVWFFTILLKVEYWIRFCVQYKEVSSEFVVLFLWRIQFVDIVCVFFIVTDLQSWTKCLE